MLTITPITNFSNTRIQNRNNVHFGSLSNPRFLNGRLIYRNDTSFFREGLDWADITERIIRDKMKVFCYASSDGSEPFTIAMCIANKLGLERTAKEFKIIARDIDERIINKAKACAISLDMSDKLNIKNFTKPEFVGLFRDLGNLENTHIVDKKLADCVDFSVGNLVYDVPSLELKKSAVFFRNVWPYLEDTEKYGLRNNLAERFDEKSLLIVGEFDTAQAFYGKEPAFEKFMINGGLRRVARNVYAKISQ